jgi:hypothetical protein
MDIMKRLRPATFDHERSEGVDGTTAAASEDGMTRTAAPRSVTGVRV